MNTILSNTQPPNSTKTIASTSPPILPSPQQSPTPLTAPNTIPNSQTQPTTNTTSASPPKQDFASEIDTPHLPSKPEVPQSGDNIKQPSGIAAFVAQFDKEDFSMGGPPNKGFRRTSQKKSTCQSYS